MASQILNANGSDSANQEVASAALSLLGEVDSLFNILEEIETKTHGDESEPASAPGKTECHFWRRRRRCRRCKQAIIDANTIQTAVNIGTQATILGVNIVKDIFGALRGEERYQYPEKSTPQYPNNQINIQQSVYPPPQPPPQILQVPYNPSGDYYLPPQQGNIQTPPSSYQINQSQDISSANQSPFSVNQNQNISSANQNPFSVNQNQNISSANQSPFSAHQQQNMGPSNIPRLTSSAPSETQYELRPAAGASADMTQSLDQLYQDIKLIKDEIDAKLENILRQTLPSREAKNANDLVTNIYTINK